MVQFIRLVGFSVLTALSLSGLAWGQASDDSAYPEPILSTMKKAAKAAAKEQPSEAASLGLSALEAAFEKKSSMSRNQLWSIWEFTVAQGLKGRELDLVVDASVLWLKQPGSPDLLSFLRGAEWPWPVQKKLLEKALVQDPDNDELRLYLGQLLFVAEQYAEAVQTLKMVSRANENWPKAYEVAAEAAHRSEQHDLAIWLTAQIEGQYPAELRRLMNRRGRGGYRLIHSLLRAQRYAWARSEAYMELAAQPDEPELVYLFALATGYATGDREGFNEMKRVLVIDSNHAGALNYLGYSLANWNENLEQAEVYLSRALRLEPENVAIIDSMAWLQYRLGNLEQARLLLLRALRDSPSSGTMIFHLACVLKKMGHDEESVGLYRRALKLETDPQEKSRFEPEWRAIQ